MVFSLLRGGRPTWRLCLSLVPIRKSPLPFTHPLYPSPFFLSLNFQVFSFFCCSPPSQIYHPPTKTLFPGGGFEYFLIFTPYPWSRSSNCNGGICFKRVETQPPTYRFVLRRSRFTGKKPYRWLSCPVSRPRRSPPPWPPAASRRHGPWRCSSGGSPLRRARPACRMRQWGLWRLQHSGRRQWKCCQRCDLADSDGTLKW